MSQKDPFDGEELAVVGVRFDEELLAIDIDSLVAVRDTQRVEQVTEQLKKIVATLANSHTVNSLPLSANQLEIFSRCSFWADTLINLKITQQSIGCGAI